MDDELLAEFLSESREHLATIEADLLTIEEAGANLDEDLVNKVFRAAHSIKGGSSFFGFTKVKELAHKAETVLDMLRSRKIAPNAEVVNLLLGAFDKLREMINNAAEREGADIAELLTGLTGLASSFLPAAQKASLTETVSVPDAAGGSPVVLAKVDVERAQRNGQCVYNIHYDLIHDIERKGVNVMHLLREVAECGEVLDCSIDFAAVGTLDEPIGNQLPMRLVYATTVGPESVHEIVLQTKEKIQMMFDPASAPKAEEAKPAAARVAEAPPARVEPAAVTVTPVSTARVQAPAAAASAPPPGPAAGEGPGAGAATAPAADETLRVSVGLLESLMNLAGELVLSRNQLRAAIARKDTQSLSVADQRFQQVSSELQEAIMRTRLQPIGNVFAKFPRVVRDMANTLKKDIQLDIRGKDVALDRSLIEGLSDPLTHMVRNAVDHGIEATEQRLAAGKKAQGTVRIEARHEAGLVVVEIADDGKGINPERVAQAALAKGLITAEKLRDMSAEDKMGLILLPGLSTAEKVTDVSGRGVGMDVVKTNIERLSGKIEIKSEAGKGSLFRIKLPLTLAIIPSLIVSAGRERFAIPQINVEELLQIPPAEVAKRIEFVSGVKVLLLRDKILPLVQLDGLLGAASAGETAGAAKTLQVAVVTTGTTEYGLVVSGFHETEEIVVKPLGRDLKGLREYAGATILGDGTVALILDVTGVATKAQIAAVSGSARAQELADGNEEERASDVHSLLLFHNSAKEVCAVPLDTVVRIERTTPERVEMAGGRRTVQYRGGSLPLVTLADAARVDSLGETRDLAVIVASVRGREVGLLGAMPVDVVETQAVVDQTTHRQPGIVGSAIIRDRTTLIADVFELVDAVYPEWRASAGEPGRAAVSRGPAAATMAEAVPTGQAGFKILLAEDSDFFRAQVKKYLEQDGFSVIEAPDGQAAWELLEEHAGEIGLVVTDVEMPRLTGLQLAERIRGDGRFAGLRVIALSSLAGEADVAKGKAAGVDEYLVKLDRDQLLEKAHLIAREFEASLETAPA